MTPEELEGLTARWLQALHRELGGTVERRHVESIGWRHFERLHRHAVITEFIPLLVYRSTKDELVEGLTEALHDAA